MINKDLLGLDIGTVRTGIARASSRAKIAEPLFSAPTNGLIATLLKLVSQYNIGTIVVGLPRNLEGNNTSQTTWVHQWVEGAKKQLNVRFFWQDEALTSKIAEASQVRGKKTIDTDALAATIVLHDFLNTPESQRVIC